MTALLVLECNGPNACAERVELGWDEMLTVPPNWRRDGRRHYCPAHRRYRPPPDPPPTIPALVSTGEAAAELRVSRQAVLDRARRGTLPAAKVGDTWVILREAIEADKLERGIDLP